VQGITTPDFQFGDYYFHARSGLHLTLTRPYSGSQGRFLNRDSAGEAGGVNLFRYVENHPVSGVDPSGRCAVAIGVIAAGPEAAIAAGALGAAAVAQAAALGNTIGSFVNAMSAMSARCKSVEKTCKSDCGDIHVPTGDRCSQGNDYWSCVQGCMKANNCPSLH
jgi:RHS repeat-associated protein